MSGSTLDGCIARIEEFGMEGHQKLKRAVPNGRSEEKVFRATSDYVRTARRGRYPAETTSLPLSPRSAIRPSSERSIGRELLQS